MSKDYANKKMFTHRHRPQHERRFFPLIGAMFAVVCLLGAIGYAFHVHRPIFAKEHFAAWVSQAKVIMSRKDKTPIKTTPPASAQHDEIQFDFYTELPNMQVNFPASAQSKLFSITAARKPVNKLAGQIDESIQSAIAQHKANSTKLTPQSPQFTVQIGEFKDPLNASQLRLSLLLAGIETEVVKIAAHTYRVQKGPYTSERQARLFQRQLSKKGFESTIKN